MVPKKVKPGSSLVDRVTFYLKNKYEPMQLPAYYDSALGELREYLQKHRDYGDLSASFRIQQVMGVSGIGLDVVRRLRNKLAHGTMRMPIPDIDGDVVSLDVEIVGLSTRVVLFTIQMLLSAHLKDAQFAVELLADEWGEPKEEPVRDVLRVLHIRPLAGDENQLPLI